MAIFVQVDSGLVINTTAVDDDDCGGGTFPASEPVGQAYLASLGLEGLWLQTSPEGQYRGCYAGIGFAWDGTDFLSPGDGASQ